MKVTIIAILIALTNTQLNTYNNNQAYFNPYANPILPYCFLGNQTVCSESNETFVNECVLLLLGQTLKHKGWCSAQAPVEKVEPAVNTTESNGYSTTDSGDAQCPMCNANFNPVCGVNGVTYTNECQLRMCAKVRLASRAPCGVPDWVKPAEAKSCNRCKFHFAPVCGKDHVTYQNSCLLNCAGVKVANEGSCLRKCGCTKIEKPVCGMNRKTYTNDCELQCDGMAKLHDGECPNRHPVGCDHCAGFYSAVCGVNGVTYDNMCYLKCSKTKLFCKTACPSLRKNCKCHQRYVPVCGIDNKTYRNECMMGCAEIRK